MIVVKYMKPKIIAGPAEPPPEPPGGGGPGLVRGPAHSIPTKDQYSSFDVEYLDLLFHVSILIAFDALTHLYRIR